MIINAWYLLKARTNQRLGEIHRSNNGMKGYHFGTRAERNCENTTCISYSARLRWTASSLLRWHSLLNVEQTVSNQNTINLWTSTHCNCWFDCCWLQCLCVSRSGLWTWPFFGRPKSIWLGGRSDNELIGGLKPVSYALGLFPSFPPSPHEPLCSALCTLDSEPLKPCRTAATHPPNHL